MSGRDFLGEFEHIVMLAVLRLGDRAYGVTVRQEIEFRTKREVSIGAVYATLDRLEAKGYVKSSLGDPTPERGGPLPATRTLNSSRPVARTPACGWRCS